MSSWIGRFPTLQDVCVFVVNKGLDTTNTGKILQEKCKDHLPHLIVEVTNLYENES